MGGDKGGVRPRWKGEKRKGPAPARHVPWPEIFKHHISVLEGHTRMIEMIQKHTVKGTGNYDTINAMTKRCHEMLDQTKSATRSFIPPAGQRETVPLGSSSLSSYPGYSPADIEYGKASSKVGQAIGSLRAKGEIWSTPGNGPEYEVGQAHSAKRKPLFRKETTESSTSDGQEKVNSDVKDSAPEPEDGESPAFFIDTNPTPVHDLQLNTRKKRALEDDNVQDSQKKTMKEKPVTIETEDISAEVEARLKKKEEKANPKEKKRRRESTEDESAEKVAKKSKKDKSKKRDVAPDEEAGDGESKKKKRKKNKDDNSSG